MVDPCINSLAPNFESADCCSKANECNGAFIGEFTLRFLFVSLRRVQRFARISVKLSEVECSALSSYTATFEPRCARFIGRLLLTKIGPEGLRDQSVYVQGVYRWLTGKFCYE